LGGGSEVRVLHADSRNEIELALVPYSTRFWIRTISAKIKEADRTLVELDVKDLAQGQKVAVDATFGMEQMSGRSSMYSLELHYIPGYADQRSKRS
jgi:hypothetical protein